MPDICFDSLPSCEIDNEDGCKKQIKRRLTIIVPDVNDGNGKKMLCYPSILIGTIPGRDVETTELYCDSTRLYAY